MEVNLIANKYNDKLTISIRIKSTHEKAYKKNEFKRFKPLIYSNQVFFQLKPKYDR